MAERTYREVKRAEAARRRASGKCVSCGNMAEPGSVRCAACKAKRRKGAAGKADKGENNEPT